MIKNSTRRFTLAIALGLTSLVAAGTAHADGTTGTDPCPKGMLCSSAAPATSGSSSSTFGTAVQVILMLLGAS